MNQTLKGAIRVDLISTLKISLKASSYTGAIKASGTSGSVDVTLGSASKWTLTVDSYISSFSGSLDNVVTNGYKLYVNDVAQK